MLKFKAMRSFPVYKKAGSNPIIFTVQKGDTVTFDQVYITKNGKVYVRAINNKGLKGWIKASQKELFRECPAWG